ncbi:MAG: hypothetical protein HOP20_09110, partial [Sulfuriferula sp.]|nr:hypothetical protein [Sulfuriferula sp.]
MMKQKILQNIKGSPLGLLLKAKLDYFQPINWRFFAFIFFGEIMLFMVFPIESHAAVSDGVLDSLLAVMKNTSAGWMSISIDFAKHLF